jgi:hypothetical protein
MGLAGVSKGIDGLIILSYLIMNVRTGRATRASDVSNLIATFHSLAGFN